MKTIVRVEREGDVQEYECEEILIAVKGGPGCFPGKTHILLPSTPIIAAELLQDLLNTLARYGVSTQGANGKLIMESDALQLSKDILV